MENFITQAIGFVGLFFAFISFQKKQRGGILFFQILASAFYFFHFLLLGAYTGSVMNLIGAFRNYIFYNREKAWAGKLFWFYLFITQKKSREFGSFYFATYIVIRRHSI